MIKVGCCGFPVAKDEYYSKFPVVEVQITFYQPPQIKTLEKWRIEAPDNFEFTVKAWQLITHLFGGPTYRRLRIRIPDNKRRYYGHFQPTDEVNAAWRTTLECARALKAKIIVFQTSPNFGPTTGNERNIRKFFKMIKRSTFHFVWEPRGAWLKEEERVKKICLDLGLTHCSVNPFRYESLSGKIDYLRLHGSVGKRIDYNYKYSKTELKKILECFQRKEDYCMFNNANMYEDAIAFKAKINPLDKSKNLCYTFYKNKDIKIGMELWRLEPRK